ncbi:MAG: carboxypeptidase-like regulatory domain-containing protein, partial [Burkholderiales bacterium]
MKDSSGAVIQGVNLTLADLGTNQARERTSAPDGNYEFRALPRGVYSLTAEQAGFKREVITDITLQ